MKPAPAARPRAALTPGTLLLLAGLAFSTRLAFQAYTHVTFEDAYISLRYAQNLASGAGLVYNPGERVFGASTPLHVLLLAGLLRLGLPALQGVKLLTALADAATCALWSAWLWRETGRRAAVALFAAFFSLSPVMVQVGVSGMETSFALLLLTAALLAELSDRPLAAGAALGGLLLLRPDGLLAAAVLWGWRWRCTGRLPWRPALLAGAIAVPWLVGASAYYGTPIPHSIPAKAAAYNLHRPSPLPNLLDTLAHVAPVRGPAGRLAANLALLPCLAAGLLAVRSRRRWRLLAVLLATWWAFLVLPKTLLFNWYYPPLLLPAYLVAALGLAALRDGSLRWRLSARQAAAVVATAVLGLAVWLPVVAWGAARVQRAELGVRRAVGLWLQHNVPAGARVAMEPIGYIGYFSGCRVLDEVGLVSPEMVPLNRGGAGWFARMAAELRPEYVVERPAYLLRNRTLNSGVPMFRSESEMRRFAAAYAPVASFATMDVPRHLQKDYRFVVFRRRGAAEAAAARQELERGGPAARSDRLTRLLAGEPLPPADPDLSPAAARRVWPGPGRRRSRTRPSPW